MTRVLTRWTKVSPGQAPTLRNDGRALEQLDEQGHESNWLVVVKLAGDHACVYDIIDAKKHPDANVLAHVAADRSFSEVCPAKEPAVH